jgi:uncharacterized protein YjbJ (UPF0337 family)
MINMQIMQGKWEEIKGNLLKRWGQLTDNDLAQFHGDADQLVGLIHRKTGEGYDVVEKYLNDLENNATSAAAAVADTVREYAGHAAKTVQHTAKEAANQAHAGCIEAKRLVRDQPLKSLVVFFGLGVFAGLVIALKRCSR